MRTLLKHVILFPISLVIGVVAGIMALVLMPALLMMAWGASFVYDMSKER